MKNKKNIIILVLAVLLIGIGAVLTVITPNENKKPNVTPSPTTTPVPTSDVADDDDIEYDNLILGVYQCNTAETLTPVSETSDETFTRKTTYTFRYDEKKVTNAELEFTFVFNSKEAFDSYDYQVVDNIFEIEKTDDEKNLTKKVKQLLILNPNLATEGNFELNSYISELESQGYTCQREGNVE